MADHKSEPTHANVATFIGALPDAAKRELCTGIINGGEQDGKAHH